MIQTIRVLSLAGPQSVPQQDVSQHVGPRPSGTASVQGESSDPALLYKGESCGNQAAGPFPWAELDMGCTWEHRTHLGYRWHLEQGTWSPAQTVNLHSSLPNPAQCGAGRDPVWSTCPYATADGEVICFRCS